MRRAAAVAGLTALSSIAALAAFAVRAEELTGDKAFGDWRSDSPGVVRHIRAQDEPPQSQSSAQFPGTAPRPVAAAPSTLPGFVVQPFAEVKNARQIRIAPNGDIFVARSSSGAVEVLRAQDGASAPTQREVFAQGLRLPYGLAFWPPGPNPQWVYVGEVNRVVRFPYRNGDLKARGEPEVIVPQIAPSTTDHVTRDLEFTPDGKRLIVAVGSATNVSEDMPAKSVEEAQAWDRAMHATGAVWGPEEHRADLLTFDPDGKNEAIYATGIRNCVTVRLEPRTHTPWCAVNERDSLGDNLPFDYVTRVKAGGFYGWPWFYIGDHEDKRPKSQRPDLAAKVIAPDVLIQAHSAPLGLAFYQASRGPAAFPKAYDGDAFVALHGSWNRAKRTGYKLVRVMARNGVPTGAYEDFLTGFVIDDRSVWGRPVGVAEAHDGALLVSDDAGGMIWRITPEKGS
ncbi:MAG TPA: PQQ-dependent sugar dehydrogenase [Caulobacteraceae bacterium]|jgi:hypothetical protein|nr:PQQ-dependent sugar dehydrogenase [Caulobacteraceae bacterium]